MSKNESILLLQSLKIKLMSLALRHIGIRNDALEMVKQTNSMIREIRKKNTKLDIELLRLIASLLSIGVEEEFNNLKKGRKITNFE
jgi:hypothetical protein